MQDIWYSVFMLYEYFFVVRRYIMNKGVFYGSIYKNNRLVCIYTHR